MYPVIDEIVRWKVGETVRTDVQRRWQRELLALDEHVARLEGQVAEMTQAKTDFVGGAKKGGRA